MNVRQAHRLRSRRDPKHRIPPLNIVQQQSDGQKQGRGEQDHRQIIPGKVPDGVVDGRKQGRCAGWRVHGLGDLHDQDGDGRGERGGEPAQGIESLFIGHEAEQLGDADADQGAEKVPENEGPRLR